MSSKQRYRKFTRVLLPTLVYILFQSAYEQIFYQGVALGEGRIIRAFILNSIGDYAGGVHWFIMSLFGMLLAALSSLQHFEASPQAERSPSLSSFSSLPFHPSFSVALVTVLDGNTSSPPFLASSSTGRLWTWTVFPPYQNGKSLFQR